VPLTKGVKSPDYSLYEVTDHGQPGETELNSTPTVVFEYGYTETSHKLALDTARHLLLSQGLVQLVVVVDVKRQPGSQDGSMTLEGVTWAHWEVDGSSFGRWNPRGEEILMIRSLIEISMKILCSRRQTHIKL